MSEPTKDRYAVTLVFQKPNGVGAEISIHSAIVDATSHDEAVGIYMRITKEDAKAYTLVGYTVLYIPELTEKQE